MREEVDQGDRAYRRLWQEVLIRAGKDSRGEKLFPSPEHKDDGVRWRADEEERIVRLAKRWLRTYSRSFQLVTDLAGMSREAKEALWEKGQ